MAVEKEQYSLQCGCLTALGGAAPTSKPHTCYLMACVSLARTDQRFFKCVAQGCSLVMQWLATKLPPEETVGTLVMFQFLQRPYVGPTEVTLELGIKTAQKSIPHA